MRKSFCKNAKFSELTTMKVGGCIERFFQPATKSSFVDLLREESGPLFIIGSGSNTLASDAPFAETVIRTRFGGVECLTKENGKAFLRADAGVIWDDFVKICVQLGLQGVENLSGIPGTVGAAVVQNIGAYGSEVSESVKEVEVWDREKKEVRVLNRDSMEFSYRTSLIKEDIKSQPPYAPNSRFIVLSALFRLSSNNFAPIKYGSIAEYLKKPMGTVEKLWDIRRAVLCVRGTKNMLEDPVRYKSKLMADMMPERLKDSSFPDDPNPDRAGCGSFFTNPVVSPEKAALLPQDAPRFPSQDKVKLSAAWLIEQAGFKKGYPLQKDPNAKVALSTCHALAITNRGSATSSDVMDLAEKIRKAVWNKFEIDLALEPVLIGLEQK